MPTVRQALRDLTSALLGIATFSPEPYGGPRLGDETVDKARESLGGLLEPIPATRLRWYAPHIEEAQRKADQGDMLMIGQLNQSMRLDGVVRGLLDARASVATFPKRYYGSNQVIRVLQSKNNSDRDVYSEMIPASEAKLMVSDEAVCGIAVGELVPVQGRDFPVLVRRFVQNLYYLWNRNTWYYRSIAGLLPIIPGELTPDGNMWVLHMGGGRLSPWNSGLWNALGRAYINKTQTIFARQSYVMKHSHPARVAFSALAGTEADRQGVLAAMIRWAPNAAFVLEPGWDLKLIESNGQGIKVYAEDIKFHNEEIATALCGSAVMLQGTAGFSNLDVFRVVNKDIIQGTATSWDHTVNTQILPAFIAQRWGVDALKNATTIETDVSEPKDRKVEADTMTSLANAIKGMVEALARAQVAAGVKTSEAAAIDVREILSRFGIPVVTQGVPDPAKLLEPANEPAPANDAAPSSEPAAAE